MYSEKKNNNDLLCNELISITTLWIKSGCLDEDYRALSSPGLWCTACGPASPPRHFVVVSTSGFFCVSYIEKIEAGQAAEEDGPTMGINVTHLAAIVIRNASWVGGDGPW